LQPASDDDLAPRRRAIPPPWIAPVKELGTEPGTARSGAGPTDPLQAQRAARRIHTSFELSTRDRAHLERALLRRRWPLT
jgi:hypothetical protein